MTMTHLYPYTHTGAQRRLRKLCASSARIALVAIVTLVLGVPQHARAKPMPNAQEQVIARRAQEAVAALESTTILNSADRNDIFDAYLSEIAIQAANFLDVDARSMQQAWLSADLSHKRALINGLTQLGVPYKNNAEIENVGFDCSGLVAFAWGKAGVDMTHGSTSQFASSTRVKVEDAQPGDLIWRPGHIAMYLGVQSAVLQTPYSGRSVELQKMNERITSWVKYANPLI